MDNIDITNKLNNRREYRDFVLSQTNLNKKNIERYRQILKVRKQESLDSKVIKNVNNFMDICFDVNMELQDLDNDILTNKKFDEFKLVSYWNQVNCDGIYASMIRQTYGSDTSYYLLLENVDNTVEDIMINLYFHLNQLQIV